MSRFRDREGKMNSINKRPMEDKVWQNTAAQNSTKKVYKIVGENGDIV